MITKGFAGSLVRYSPFFYCFPLTTWSQSFNATLTESVTDPSGLPVPDVESIYFGSHWGLCPLSAGAD